MGEEALQDLLVPIEMEIPYAKSVEMNSIHEKGHVENIDYRETGTYVEARVPQSIANRLLSQHDIVRYNEDGTVAAAAKKRKPKKKKWIGRHWPRDGTTPRNNNHDHKLKKI